jgi:hypothetical protein
MVSGVRAKVKITVVDTKQEYLLLVAKMNLKGILVNTSQTLPPNTKLLLELKLTEQDPMMLQGYVHKTSEESASRKGMVIAFQHPNEEAKKKIQRFIDASKDSSSNEIPQEPEPKKESKKDKKGKWTLRKKDKEVSSEGSAEVAPEETPKKKKEEKPIKQNKTMIVGDEDLPTLSLLSPDSDKELSSATIDEESIHAMNPGMAGSTRHVKIDPKNPTKKAAAKKPFKLSTIYKAFGFVVVLIVLILTAKPILTFMDKKFGVRLLPVQNKTATTGTTPPVKAEVKDNAPATAGTMDSIQVEDQGGFLKVSLSGKGNFANNEITKMADVKKIHIVLKEISESTAKSPMNVNNNPLNTIESKKEGNTIVIDLVCAGNALPNYEAKVFKDGLDIFIYR